MKVRYANLDDVPKIVEIYSYYVLNKPYTFETEVPTIEEYAKNRMIEFKKFFPFFVLEDENGEVVGYSYAHFYHERRAYQWNAETTIYIQEGLQRKGLGSMLYKPLLDALKDQGFTNALAIWDVQMNLRKIFTRKWDLKIQQYLRNKDLNLESGMMLLILICC